ncbi:hypothetical protein [Streptomyces hydrogenans]|uniref:hypothetical protein n=1 Tax=Streptomyces hydrogenans TaxID=1873719 RepID=UPI00342F3E9B
MVSRATKITSGDPAIAVLELAGIAAASTAAVGTAAYLALTRKRRELTREWVLPLHEALALPLRLPDQTDPRRYLHIPRNFSEDDAVIRVDVPGRLDFSKDLVVDIITTKLALEGVTFSWHLAGRETYVTVKKTRKPPAKAAFKDPKIREIVAAAKESAPVIGIGSAGRIVTSVSTPNPRTSSSTPPPAAASRSPCGASPARCSTTARSSSSTPSGSRTRGGWS